MNRSIAQLVFTLCVFWSVFAWSSLVSAQPGATCWFQENVEQTCRELGCIPIDATQAHRTGKGRCAPCNPSGGVDGVGTDQCGGRACREDRTCEPSKIPKPVPVWPTFHLLVIDATVTVGDASGYSGKPIVGAGYFFQGALGKTDPKAMPDGGWSTLVPSWYIEAGATMSFAGAAQNVFLTLGLAKHVPSWPLAITSVSLDALYQRAGTTIWELDTRENVDRLGPTVVVGFLYNLFVRGGYVWPLNRESPQGHGAAILSLVYMRDLLGDLVPDRFQKYVPAAYRGPGEGG